MENNMKVVGNDIVEIEASWVGAKEFPFEGTIVNVEPVKGKFRTDYRLTLMHPLLGLRQFDLWGQNLNYMVNTAGKHYAAWIGIMALLNKDNDGKRLIEIVN